MMQSYHPLIFPFLKSKVTQPKKEKRMQFPSRIDGSAANVDVAQTHPRTSNGGFLQSHPKTKTKKNEKIQTQTP